MMTGMDQDLLIKRLDDIIRRSVPDVAIVPKYGGELYTLHPEEKEAQFCGIFPYKEHVQLAFSNGTALRDPRGVLVGTGKFRKHINFSKAEEIDVEVVVELIKEAAELSR